MIEQCKSCKNKEIINGIIGCVYMDADCQNGEKYEAEIITNADRIRAMSDEELANAFHTLYRKLHDGTLKDLGVLFCDGKNHCITKCGNIRCSDKKEKACVLRWLKQPAEDEMP